MKTTKKEKSNIVLIVDENIGRLLANPAEPVGGATVQSLQWASGFVSRGYIVHILTKSSTLSVKSDYNLHFIPDKADQLRVIGGLNVYISLVKLIYKLKPMLIYVSTAGWQTIQWGTICRFLRVKYVQRISNNIVFDPVIYKKKHGFLKYYLSYMGVQLSSLILCQNNIQAKNINKVFPRKKWMIVHNPVAFSGISPFSSRNGQYVAWIGLFQYQKNLPVLYSIAKELKTVNFKIAGVALNKIDENTSIALADLQKLDNVEFVGMVSRSSISDFLGNAICLLNTSFYEGFSNTFLEAFLAGVPIITRSIIDPDGIIEKNNLGIIVSEYEEMPAAIKKIESTYNDYTQRVFRYVIENHDAKILVDMVIQKL